MLFEIIATTGLISSVVANYMYGRDKKKLDQSIDRLSSHNRDLSAKIYSQNEITSIIEEQLSRLEVKQKNLSARIDELYSYVVLDAASGITINDSINKLNESVEALSDDLTWAKTAVSTQGVAIKNLEQTIEEHHKANRNFHTKMGKALAKITNASE